MKALNGLALILVIVGALNWGLVAIAEFDVVAEIFGEEFGTTNAYPGCLRARWPCRCLSRVHAAWAVISSDDRLAFGRRDHPHGVR